MAGLSTLDAVVLAVLGVAVVRGLAIGLIREGFSIAALGGALLAVRYGVGPVAGWIAGASRGDLGGTASTWIAGIAIGLGTVAVLGTAGRLLRRGARAVGLGWADRVGGGLIGAVEGALAAAVVLVVATWAAGPESPLVENARSVDVLENVQSYLAEHREELPAVAAPPEWFEKARR